MTSEDCTCAGNASVCVLGLRVGLELNTACSRKHLLFSYSSTGDKRKRMETVLSMDRAKAVEARIILPINS